MKITGEAGYSPSRSDDVFPRQMWVILYGSDRPDPPTHQNSKYGRKPGHPDSAAFAPQIKSPSFSHSVLMASDNDDSTVTAQAHHHPNASPVKPDTPPLLKRSKTIAVDASQTPHFPGPLFPAVRRVSTAPLSAYSFRQPTDLRLSIDNDTAPAPDGAQFFNRDYIFPSCLGPYASKPRLTLKVPKHANQDLSTASSFNRRLGSSRVQGTVAEQSPPKAPPSKVQESKKQEKLVKQIGRPDSVSQSSMRRFWKPTHSLMHYLVSVSIFFLFLFSLFLACFYLDSAFSKPEQTELQV